MKNAKIILNRLYKKLKEDMANSKEREKIAKIAGNYEKEHTEHIFQVGLQLPIRYIEEEAKDIKRDEQELIITKQLEKGYNARVTNNIKNIPPERKTTKWVKKLNTKKEMFINM